MSDKTLSHLLPIGSIFKVEPHPGTIEGRQAVRYWLTEVADASVDPADRPISADTFELQDAGSDYIRLTQTTVEGTPGHPPILLPLSAVGFLSV